jgi:Xaa-Pro aminopeptidase
LEPPFRLSEAWYRRTTRRLQQKLAERDLDGMILSDQWNIIYYTGLFHSSTERPFWVFIPAEGDATIFYPGLDRDLVETWWMEDREWYFDYPHHGPFNQVVYEPGPAVDLWAWMLEGLASRGYGDATLGIENEVGPTLASRLATALPHASFLAVGEICEKMRQIKTAEEIELIRKAVALEDHMLAYARALILEHGTDLTDFDVRLETERYATDLLMEWLEVDGGPHTGVGLRLSLYCRAGRATGYPHPNQFPYHRIQPGDAVQIATFTHIGGYVGEGYRAMQILPMSGEQRKVWEIHTEMTELQARLCRSGAVCNEIAGQVLRLARDAGLESYVYHRPSHSIGMEGHQAPYISLGDETKLQEGMIFSNEPGLYNPSEGWGYNHSNTVLVEKGAGKILNKTPLTEDWCWIAI